MMAGRSFAVPSSIYIEAISSEHSLDIARTRAEKIFVPSRGLSMS
jgi:hypothetical protein